MKTIRNLAWANTKYHRGKNILSGVAIILTTALVYLILSIGIGSIDLQNHVTNKIYPTFHTMYRGVSEVQKEQLILHDSIEQYGLRQDVGIIDLDDSEILMSYLDQEALSLNKVELSEGTAPSQSNEIALPRAALVHLGFPEVQLGDSITLPYQVFEGDGLSFEQTAEFQLTGILPDPETDDLFSMLISQDFMTASIPENQRSYRVLLRINAYEATTTDAIEELSQEIATSFDIPENEVIVNSEYLFANYVDPSFYTGLVLVIAIILIAGALTIYSIYYVSLINKVQEFGKLKALGASKRQIRLAVLFENLIVAFIAIPIGLLISIASSEFIFNQLILNADSDNQFVLYMREALQNNEASLFVPWIAVLAVVVTLLTVLISSLKPMRYASKIMPIEAMRYTGQAPTKQKKRKGYINLNLQRLAGANLSRNKKRTLMTIFSLGLIGILFLVISTILSCANPAQIARDSIAEDIRLSIDDSTGDRMHPEQEWEAIQQNNPLDEEMINQIANLDGVEEVWIHQKIDLTIPAFSDGSDDLPLTCSIGGLEEAQFNEIRQYLVEPITYEELASEDKIIASSYIMSNFPEIQVGDQLECEIQDGDRTYTKVFTVAALADIPRGYTHYVDFVTSNDLVESLSQNNLNHSLDIRATDSEVAAVEEQLTALAAQEEFFILSSFRQLLEQWESSLTMMGGAGYGIMFVLAVVGIMNLVNTTIDSILTRKKELGVMQAIGMSNRQMRKMLREEGLFYAGGIILLSVGFGSLFGYFAYLYAAANGMFDIKVYSYPIVQVILLILVVLIVQLTLTFTTTNLINKESVISRIQNSE